MLLQNSLPEIFLGKALPCVRLERSIMEEKWGEIRGFESYKVSNHGRIARSSTGRPLRFYLNQQGVVCVGLMRGHVQFKRSVPLLVARAFIPKPARHDTPINLDGDRWNCHVENLAWRPRWFAVEYNRQFQQMYDYPITKPIRDVKTGEVYPDSFRCAIANGLLEKDVVLSISNRTYVWPTYQIFEVV